MWRFLGGSGSYPAAFLFSFALHLLLLVVLTVNWHPDDAHRKIIRPQYIEATLMQIKEKPPEAKPKAQPKEQPKIDNTAEKRKQEELKRQQEKKRLAEQERKRQQELKRKKEQAEKEKREREEQRKKEEQRKQEEAKRQQQQAEARRQEELRQQALEEEQVAMAYAAYVEQRIANNWSRPPSARRGMEVILGLQLTPNGQVVSVWTVKSSGDSAFDRSAEQAVLKVERFERLVELEPAVFERHFRKLTLVFNPEDLRQ